MTPLDELAPGLWQWQEPRGGIPPTMTAYALRDGEDTILVDPLSGPLRPKGFDADEPLLAALDEIVRGRVRILITTPFHVRGSELLWRRWRDRHEVTILGHEQCTHPIRRGATAAAPWRRRWTPRGTGRESAGEQERRHRPDRRGEADEIGDEELDRPRAGGLRMWLGDRRLRLLGKEKAGDASRLGGRHEHELGAHWVRCGEN